MVIIFAFRHNVNTTLKWICIALIKQVLLYKGWSNRSLSRWLSQILSCLIWKSRNLDWCHTLISRWPKSAAAIRLPALRLTCSSPFVLTRVEITLITVFKLLRRNPHLDGWESCREYGCGLWFESWLHCIVTARPPTILLRPCTRQIAAASVFVSLFTNDVVSILDCAVSEFRLIREILVCQTLIRRGKFLFNGNVNFCR